MELMFRRKVLEGGLVSHGMAMIWLALRVFLKIILMPLSKKSLGCKTQKEGSWDLIRRLKRNCDMPQIICGDFNEILYSYEKKEGIPRDERRMENFRQVLEECNLVDGDFSRPWFTWEMVNLPETNIRERLDRGLVSLGW
ncbi:hypothetical protein PVK06_011849 [Gossypium arboreum]|uniref:Reverse transcriptase n=1 Tax=Gossypium arboreum TaxID=29729 RepID=A0ABR0Q9X1_GOSAR|nr:hypothetical protein PVK06_011849 [Gossypium arboreum]